MEPRSFAAPLSQAEAPDDDWEPAVTQEEANAIATLLCGPEVGHINVYWHNLTLGDQAVLRPIRHRPFTWLSPEDWIN